MTTDIRVRISGSLAPHVALALEREAGNSRALAASFQECAKTSAESWFTKAAAEELKLAKELDDLAARISCQLITKND